MEHQTFDVLTKFLSFGLFVGQVGASHKRIKASVTCSGPEFLCWGGGGVVQGRLLETSLNNVFFSFFHQLIYSIQRGSDCLSMVLFQRKLLFPGFRGVPSLIQGSPPFSRGPAFSRVGDSNAIFNRNPYNL